MSQPNILVVLSDQQRPDSCGVYGQALPVTPVLDQLASTGVVFDDAFTVQPLCGPARAALQTGVLPTTLGCWRNGLALPPETETLASRLGALGYQTGYIGKWHLASDRGPRLPADRAAARFEKRPVPRERRGGYNDVWVAADALEMTTGPNGGRIFDENNSAVDLDGYRVDALTDVAIDRIKKFDSDRPFLLFVSHLCSARWTSEPLERTPWSSTPAITAATSAPEISNTNGPGTTHPFAYPSSFRDPGLPEGYTARHSPPTSTSYPHWSLRPVGQTPRSTEDPSNTSSPSQPPTPMMS